MIHTFMLVFCLIVMAAIIYWAFKIKTAPNVGPDNLLSAVVYSWILLWAGITIRIGYGFEYFLSHQTEVIQLLQGQNKSALIVHFVGRWPVFVGGSLLFTLLFSREKDTYGKYIKVVVFSTLILVVLLMLAWSGV